MHGKFTEWSNTAKARAIGRACTPFSRQFAQEKSVKADLTVVAAI
jgi:hypothetical protein